MEDDSDTALKAVISDAIETLAKFAVPLYVNDDHGRPQQFGSGFFVRAQGAHFLVSAAHVLDKTRDHRVFFYAAPRTLRFLTGPVLTTGHPDSRRADALDVGVMKLADPGLPPYPEVGKFPVDISYLRSTYLPRADKHYVIVGFPASKSTVDNRERLAFSVPYAYRSDSIPDDEYPAEGLNTKTHVALPLNLKKGFDVDGHTRSFPKPNGMSGSPIVVLYETHSETQSRTFPVVAIGIEYRKNPKLLVGTDVGLAIGAIQEFLRR